MAKLMNSGIKDKPDFGYRRRVRSRESKREANQAVPPSCFSLILIAAFAFLSQCLALQELLHLKGALRMDAQLPNFFSFRPANDLVRIGNGNDGGYLVSRSDVDNSDVLIGLGIGDNWSFEEDFLNRREVELYAYDASISERFFKQNIRHSLRGLSPFGAAHWIKVMLNYRSFFSKSRNHHIEKFIGFNSVSGDHCDFNYILETVILDNIFIKIDVEGSEYRFLDKLILNQHRLSGIVIEFHDCDLHLEKIRDFIDRIDLKLVHIHANNTAPIRKDDGLPLVLELTFSRNCELGIKACLPHELDMPSNRKTQEISLSIAD